MYTTQYTPEKDLRQAIFFSLSEKDYKIVNFLLVALLRYKCIFPSRKLISTHTGISLRTIDRCLVRLKYLQVIKSRRRFDSSSVYQIHEDILKEAPTYWHVFPSLKDHWKLHLKRSSKMALGLLLVLNGSLSVQGSFNNTKHHDVIHHTMHHHSTKHIQIDHDLTYDHQYFLKNKGKAVEVPSRSILKATEKLGLTPIGIAKCSVLSDNAIDYAIGLSRSYRSFGEFFDCGVEYSKKHQLPLSWANYYTYVNNNEVAVKPVFMVSSERKVVVPTLLDNSGRIETYRAQRKECYQQLMVDRPDLNSIALEYQAMGFVAGIEKPSEDIGDSSFDDGCPLVPSFIDDEIDYTLTIT